MLPETVAPQVNRQLYSSCADSTDTADAGLGVRVSGMQVARDRDRAARTGLQATGFVTAYPAPVIESAMEIFIRLELVIDVEISAVEYLAFCSVSEMVTSSVNRGRQPSNPDLVVALQDQVRRKNAPKGRLLARQYNPRRGRSDYPALPGGPFLYGRLCAGIRERPCQRGTLRMRRPLLRSTRITKKAVIETGA